MPFGLKNAGTTYLRAMKRIFDDMLHKNVECYVDDSWRYQLKMNPLKCSFGVTSGKFLGFVVRRHGIEIEQAKIDAITELAEPRNIHELKTLQGKLAYLRRYISNLVGKCQPFSKLMKKEAPFIWDATCSTAFQDIKSYLASLPVLAAPMQRKPLILYIAAQE
ncbi:hypothetical protein LIER_05016 [Lithospermum erythrorhizon]|uniref:Uncharacterized protein n=1 Tax=Lithospermum erythrorhizon TaxID=34254 RepID=A0AAV3NZF8_LITER